MDDKVGDKQQNFNRNVGDDIMHAEDFVQKCHQRHFGEDYTAGKYDIADE